MNNILCFIKGIFNNQWTFSEEETGMNFWNTLWFFIGYCIAISTFSLYKQVREVLGREGGICAGLQSVWFVLLVGTTFFFFVIK